jgi:hypothetical protein
MRPMGDPWLFWMMVFVAAVNLAMLAVGLLLAL